VKKKRGYMVCSSGYAATDTSKKKDCKWRTQVKKKKRGYRVCSSGYAATDTS
jgi:hypothetical protein